MRDNVPRDRTMVFGALLAALLAWPVPGEAQQGQARAVQANVMTASGISSTTLADTGTLGGATDAREASQLAASIPAFLSGEALHATAVGGDKEAKSEASIANLSITVENTTISADFAMARVMAGRFADAGTTQIDGLAVNGSPVQVTGERNQQVAIPGGVIVINEQKKGASGTLVNALHIFVDGAADIVIASASAKAQ